MVSEFKWPESIPSGQRTYRTPSCLIRKTIKSIKLVYPDEETLDLFETNEIDEKDKLVFISAVMGSLCGAKNKLYAGYLQAAKENIIDDYEDCHLIIEWLSDGKKDIKCSWLNLKSAMFYLYDVINPSFSTN